MGKARVVIATHGHCFDGMASAALFTRLYQEVRGSAGFEAKYRSCGYGPGMSAVPPQWLDGDENAILDFRYTKAPKLTWYFDHHVTGFGSAEEREAAGGPEQQVFYDPGYGSCTKLIADVGAERFGVPREPLADLVRWADLIDAARFASAEAAVDRSEPVLQLASVVEHHGDGPFLAAVVPKLLERPVGEVARDPEILRLWGPIAAAQEAYVARVRRAAKVMGRVVLVDLSDAPLDVAGKFVTYALYPQCVYSVTLLRTKQHHKLSVGYNPWSGVERAHDIAAICKRYGGGGHPVVGAASFPLGALDAARAAATAVAVELDG